MYSCSVIEKLIASAIDAGYEVRQFAPESLGYGGVALIAPPCEKEGYEYPHIIIEEKYLNEWSSGHTVRKCRKISKRIQKLIDKYMEG